MFFFFNDTATTEIYTLSLHDALPIWSGGQRGLGGEQRLDRAGAAEVPALAEVDAQRQERRGLRSEEHTSELQSRQYLVCRLLLEKKNTNSHPPSSLLHCADFISCHPP